MLENIFYKQPKDLTYGRGYTYSLQYHVVWCTKYRKPVLKGKIADDVKLHLTKTASDIGISIDAMEVMPDHVHLLIDCKPQFCPADGIKILKGNTARWLFMAYPELKRELWGGHLWNPSYFIATVSERSAEQVRTYIANQQTGPGKPGNPAWRKG